MKSNYLKNKSFWKKAFKLAAFFQALILFLAFLKSLLSGDIGGLTMMGFMQAVLISFICGLIAGVSLAYKDEFS
jgi:fatty-acid desaturase